MFAEIHRLLFTQSVLPLFRRADFLYPFYLHTQSMFNLCTGRRWRSDGAFARQVHIHFEGILLFERTLCMGRRSAWVCSGRSIPRGILVMHQKAGNALLGTSNKVILREQHGVSAKGGTAGIVTSWNGWALVGCDDGSVLGETTGPIYISHFS